MESLSFSPRHPEGKKSPPFQSFPSPCFIHIVLPPLTFLDPATAPQNRDTTWKVMQKVRGTEVKMRGSGARKRRERKKHHEQITVFSFFFFALRGDAKLPGHLLRQWRAIYAILAAAFCEHRHHFPRNFLLLHLAPPR